MEEEEQIRRDRQQVLSPSGSFADFFLKCRDCRHMCAAKTSSHAWVCKKRERREECFFVRAGMGACAYDKMLRVYCVCPHMIPVLDPQFSYSVPDPLQ